MYVYYAYLDMYKRGNARAPYEILNAILIAILETMYDTT